MSGRSICLMPSITVRSWPVVATFRAKSFASTSVSRTKSRRLWYSWQPPNLLGPHGGNRLLLGRVALIGDDTSPAAGGGLGLLSQNAGKLDF
jgi:hypothetical protein